MSLVARHAALTDIGLHRKTNEDTYVVQPPLFAVCDGMGGAQAGEVASGLAAETLAREVAAGRPLGEAAEAANSAVFARASRNAEQSGMGTTLTALVLGADEARFAHIGDSRAYLLRGERLSQLTDDHSLVGEMVREGRLTPQEAAVHPHRSILSRALGTEPSRAGGRVRRGSARRRRAAAVQRRSVRRGARRGAAPPPGAARPGRGRAASGAGGAQAGRPGQHHRRGAAPGVRRRGRRAAGGRHAGHRREAVTHVQAAPEAVTEVQAPPPAELASWRPRRRS